ncbi:hypothetical protein LSAT2_031744 [Lamellibrachia satsuma]|nr:hypothetical protein LSAT2_031744 [Lamellibrachia satsuma]
MLRAFFFFSHWELSAYSTERLTGPWNSLMPAALKWTSPGKTKRDRRMGTCRTVEEERKLAGKTRIELSWPAQDRAGWRRFVGA